MDGQGNEKLVSEATSTTGQVSAPAACLSCETYLHEDGRTRVSSSNLILFHVCKLRTGTKKEKADACIHLGKYAAASNDLRSQVLAAGGLASLIQAWPDAQFASAKAIAHAILGVDDAWVLLQFSRGILDALRLLLVTSKEARRLKQQRRQQQKGRLGQREDQEGEEEKRMSAPSSSQAVEDLMADEMTPCHYRHLVARVLAHMIVIIKQEWRQASGDAPPTSERFLAWTRSKTKSSSTITGSLERVVELAMMLAEDDCGKIPPPLDSRPRPGPDPATPSQAPAPAHQEGLQPTTPSEPGPRRINPSDQDATILTAFSLAQTAHVEASRVLLVNRGLLPILEEWLTSRIKDLERQAVSIVASLCQRSGQALDVYTRGFIDAKILASGILPHLLPLASSNEPEIREHVAEALADLSKQTQNRESLVKTGGISSLVLLLGDAAGDLIAQAEVAEHALIALNNLAMDHQEGGEGAGKLGKGLGRSGAGVALGGSGGSGCGSFSGGGGGNGGRESSPCLLIAKEGGIEPLVTLMRCGGLSRDATPEQHLRLRSSTISLAAILSQHPACRVAFFETPHLVDTLLAVGINSLREVERGSSHRNLRMRSPSTGWRVATSPPTAQEEEEKAASLRATTVEAVHVAFTLANLAAVGNSFHERELVESGAAPVLVRMCKCPIPEVVEQAVRGLAQLCRPLIRGFVAVEDDEFAERGNKDVGEGRRGPGGARSRGAWGKGRPLRTVEDTQDEQLRLLWSNETLQTMLSLVLGAGSSQDGGRGRDGGARAESIDGSGNAGIQAAVRLEAVRALATLARVADFSFRIVRPQGGVLKELLKLAVDPSALSGGDGELRMLAEEALVNLGFEGGSKALELCGNDRGLLLDWWVMERNLEDQRAANEELSFAVEAMMALNDGRREGGGASNVTTAGTGGAVTFAEPLHRHHRHPQSEAHEDRRTAHLSPSLLTRAGTQASPLTEDGAGMERAGAGGGAGGLGGLIKEVANLRLRDLLLMCLTPAAVVSGTLSGVRGAKSSGAGAETRGSREDMAESGSHPSPCSAGRQLSSSPPFRGREGSSPPCESRDEGNLASSPLAPSIPVALQPPQFRGASSFGEFISGVTGGAGRDGSSASSGGRRETLLSCLLNPRRQASAEDGGKEQDGRFARDPWPSLGAPLALPEVGSLSFNLQLLMDRFFPSPLTQYEVLPLTALGLTAGRGRKAGLEFVRVDGRGGGGGGGRQPSASGWSGGLWSGGAGTFETVQPPTWRALDMPSRAYFSFRREGRVLSKLLKKHGSQADFWSLSFYNSSFQGEFSQAFLERLHVLPKVKSLVFQASRPEQGSAGTSLAYLVGGVPSWVRHVTFERVLNRDSLVILSHILATKSLHAASMAAMSSAASSSGGAGKGAGIVSGTQQPPGLALQGLAIRHHAHLRPEDFSPLFSFLRKEGGAPAPLDDDSAQLGSGRKGMGPEGGESGRPMSQDEHTKTETPASPVPVPTLSRQPSLLGYVGMRYLDLTGNNLGDAGAAEAIKALTCYSPTLDSLGLASNGIKNASLLLDAVAAFVHHRGSMGWLRTLLLDDNALTAKAMQRLFTLLEEDTSLENLSLAANAINDSKPLVEGLRRLLRRNRMLIDLNLSKTRLGVEGGRELLFGLLENQTLRYLRLQGGNEALKAEERELIERQLAGNRRRFYAPLTKLSRPVRMTVTGPPPSSSSWSQGAASQTRDSQQEQSGPQGRDRGQQKVPGTPEGNFQPQVDERASNSAARRHSPPSSPIAVQSAGYHHRSISEPVRGRRHRGRSADKARAGEEENHEREETEDEVETDDDRYEGEEPMPTMLEVGGRAGSLGAEGRDVGPFQGSWAIGDGEGKVKEEEGDSTPASQRDVLSVLFSAPLAWRDLEGNLHPIELLFFDQEREQLVQSLMESGSDICARFDFCTTDTLRSAVTLGARALHYSGHGHRNLLTFEDGAGGLQLVPVDMLRSLCAAGSHKLDLVVVSSCYSKLAGQAFVDAEVPHVVCINLEATITDSAALAFTKAFYLSLFVGNTVQHSFAIGQQAVAASPNVPSPEREVSKFELLPEGCDHNVAIFTAPQPTLTSWGSGRSMGAEAPWLLQQEQQAHLPTPPEDFLGREVSMYRVVNACLYRRLVTLLGLGGIGKSALAAACCHYMALRRFHTDGIVFVRLQGKSSLEELIQSIIQGVLRQIPARGGGAGGLGSGHGAPSHALASTLSPTAPPFASSLASIGGLVDDGILERDEEWLFARLRTAKVLIVLDHLQELQAGHDGINVKIFLSQLFEQTRATKVLITTTRPLDLHTLPGSGNGVMGETLVSVGPLTFKNTVRLFSRLCPHLHTARDRRVSSGRQVCTMRL
jgi:hypothetical protein